MIQYNVRAIPFKPEHLKHIKVRSEQSDDLLVLKQYAIADGLLSEAAKGEYGLPACRTIVVDGEPVCAFGVVNHGNGLCEGWGYFSEKVKGHGIIVCREMISMVEHCKYRRLQTYCKASFATSRRMLERVGFSCEATLKGASPDGDDLCIYSVVR